MSLSDGVDELVTAMELELVDAAGDRCLWSGSLMRALLWRTGELPRPVKPWPGLAMRLCCTAPAVLFNRQPCIVPPGTASGQRLARVGKQPITDVRVST